MRELLGIVLAGFVFFTAYALLLLWAYWPEIRNPRIRKVRQESYPPVTKYQARILGTQIETDYSESFKKW